MKVAIVYDRVNKWGGAERVLLALHEMFPSAPLYTSVYDKRNAPWAKVFPKIHTSFLQKIPFAKNNHELFAWLMPLAFEHFNFDDYELVISVTSEAAKGIITKPHTLHVCYCLTPTRYLWSGESFYFSNPPEKFKFFPFFKYISLPFRLYLKRWDKIASQRPDKMIAISTEVKKRVKKYYSRNSEVIYPPAELENETREQIKKKDYFLIVGRFEPYKKLGLVIRVFNKLGADLIVAGSGSEFRQCAMMARKNIKFIFNPTDTELINLYLSAKALIMPQDEDFGIVSVEAQSMGVPVIAFKSGGALDTVIDKKTGILFDEQTEESLMQAISKFAKIDFNRVELQSNAKKFSKKNFKRQLQRSLIRANYSWRRRHPSLAKISR